MPYADTDFFLAIIKETDWLKSRAYRLKTRYKGLLWTSLATLIELLLLSRRYGLDPEIVAISASEIAEVRGVGMQVVLLAAHYMREKGLNTFDAVHAAFVGADEIISSDKVFDRVGLRRIPLEKAG